MNIDPTLAKFVGWILAFLFTSLISIIIWLARSVLSKIDTIVKYQEEDSIERAVIKKDIDTIKTSINVINTELRDIPEIKEKLVKIETNEKHLLQEIDNYKKQQNKLESLIKDLQDQVNAQDKLIIEIKNN